MITVNNELSFYPNSCTEKNILNGEKTLDFHLVKTKDNEEVFERLEIESHVSLESEEYIIKEKEMYMTGKHSSKRLFAMHIFFELANTRIDEELTGNIELADALSFVFNNSEWDYKLFGDTFSPIAKEIFGNDNKLALFTSILTDWNVEYILDTPNRIVEVYAKAGELVDHTFRYNHNIKTMRYTDNSRELKTAIKGYGKDGLTVSYVSPNATKFTEKWQEPIRDDNVTDSVVLLEMIKAALKDEPEFTVNIEVTQIGNDYEPVIGDAVLTIHEPLGIDIDTRIVETTRYPFNKSKKTQVVLSNISANEALKISNIYKQLAVARKTNADLLEKYKKVVEKVEEVDAKADEADAKAGEAGEKADAADAKVEEVSTKVEGIEQSQFKIAQGAGKTNTEIQFVKPFLEIPLVQVTPTSTITDLYVLATKTGFKAFSAADYNVNHVTFNWLVIYKSDEETDGEEIGG